MPSLFMKKPTRKMETLKSAVQNIVIWFSEANGSPESIAVLYSKMGSGRLKI